MKEKGIIFGMGLACGLAIMLVPACASKKQTDEPKKTTVAGSLLGKDQPKQGQQPSDNAKIVDSVDDRPKEYYIGHLDAGQSSRFFTTRKTYRVGDRYEGLLVVGCLEAELITYDAHNDRLKHTYFEKKPKEEPEPQKRVPENTVQTAS